MRKLFSLVIVLYAAFNAHASDSETIKEMIQKYEGGTDLWNEQTNEQELKTSISREAALGILQKLTANSANAANPKCKLVDFSQDQESASIVHYTNQSVGRIILPDIKSYHLRSSPPLIQFVEGIGRIDDAALMGTAPDVQKQLGELYKSLTVRMVRYYDPKVQPSKGTQYSFLKVYYTESSDGIKLLKIRTQKFNARSSSEYRAQTIYLEAIHEISGTCYVYRNPPVTWPRKL